MVQRMKHGFTLIELLVVIAIIAILASILFPVFAKAREKARQTTCMNNQRQIATAIQIYTQDHDEMYPESATIWEEIKLDKGVLKCLSAPRKPNGYVFLNAMSGKPLAEITDPVNTMVTCDGVTVTNVTDAKPNILYTPAGFDFRHADMFIGAYADGHVAIEKTINATAFGLVKIGEMLSTNDYNFDLTVNPAVVGTSAALQFSKTYNNGWQGTSIASGELKQYNLGKSGYVLYNHNNSGNTITAYPTNPTLTITKTGGSNVSWLKFKWSIQGGTAAADPAGAINGATYTINNTGDPDAVHILTVFCPQVFNEMRNFTISVSTNTGAEREAAITAKFTSVNSSIHQYEFKGNIKVITSGEKGFVNAIFLD